MIDPNKKIVSVIMERIKPSKEGDPMAAKKEMLESFPPEDEESDDEGEMDNEEGCLDCCQAMITAFKTGNASELHKALMDYMELTK